MNKQYPLRDNGREFHLCICSHDKDKHNISWFSKNNNKCNTCECPNYERDPDTTGLYIECNETEGTISSTREWTGCKTFYKKV